MAIPFLTDINLSDNQLLNAKLQVTTGTPTNAIGQIYFNTNLSENRVRVHNGTEWNSVAWLTDLHTHTLQLTNSTFISLSNSGTAYDPNITASLSATGTPDNTKYLRGDNTWSEISTIPGTYTWTIGDGVNSEAVASNNTITIVGSGATSTLYNPATNTLTISSTDNNTDTLQSISSNTTDGVLYITTVGSPSGGQSGYSSPNFTYNASTSTLSVPNIIVTGTQTVNNVEVVSTSSGVVFEGLTNDGFETTLNVINPTADRSIYLPNNSGTIALISDIPTVNNGQLSISVSGSGLTVASTTFTANQSGNSSITISHADTSTQASVNNSGYTFIQDITLDTYGHITGIVSADASTLVAAREYAATVGGATSIAVNHGLATTDVIVQLYEIATGYTIYADVVRTNTSTVTLGFTTAPAAASIRVLISKIG